MRDRIQQVKWSSHLKINKSYDWLIDKNKITFGLQPFCCMRSKTQYFILVFAINKYFG